MNPNGSTIWVESAAGERVDITEGVQALYDLVTTSMDWGSGFWTVEDALPVVKIADLCAYDSADEARSYVETKMRQQAAHAERLAQQERDRTAAAVGLQAHRDTGTHLIDGTSSTCAWPGCHAPSPALYEKQRLSAQEAMRVHRQWHVLIDRSGSCQHPDCPVVEVPADHNM